MTVQELLDAAAQNGHDVHEKKNGEVTIGPSGRLASGNRWEAAGGYAIELGKLLPEEE